MVGTCVPVVLAVYFVLTWVLYLRHPQSPNGTNFSSSGSRTVFYSWFVLGVIGLDLSEYGLLGVEASMLMTAFWGAPNAWHVILHGDHSWSGPDGWMEALKAQFGDGTSGGRRARIKRAPRRLWWLLAAPSILLFVGLPLTGLSMELKSGFRKTNQAPNVVGRNWTTFNERSHQATVAAAHSTWSLATPPRIPAFGIIFANDAAESDDPIFTEFNSRDNVLATETGVKEVFLVPQADAPFTGKVWGMIVSYNCSVVHKLEEFTILSRRNGSQPFSTASKPYDFTSYYVDDYTIEVHNQTLVQGNVNYQAVAELGYSNETYGDSFFASQNSTKCYFNKTEGASKGYPGLAHNSTLELAIWQIASDHEGLVYPPLPPSTYNFTLDETIASLRGAYHASGDEQEFMGPMDAIGVQCRSSSAVGTAYVDGVTSIYTGFEESDTPVTQNYFQCAPRLALAVPELIFQGDTVTNSWSEDFFTAADAQRSILAPESDDSVVFALVRPTLLQASELRRSLLRAYGTYAVQLMYDGPQGYTLRRIAGDGNNFTNDNATGYYPAPVLVRGPVPPALPGTLLIIWALISCILSFRYGFQRRWADTLDSFSLFQFGGDISDKVKVKEMPVYSFKDFRDHEQLNQLPGLVGDLRPGFSPGHVTLVERKTANEARRTKKYV